MRDVQAPSGRFTAIAPVGGGFGGVLWGSREETGGRTVRRGPGGRGGGVCARGWNASQWGETLVPRDEAAGARGILSDYIAELERGGAVRDEDVEGQAPE